MSKMVEYEVMKKIFCAGCEEPCDETTYCDYHRIFRTIPTIEAKPIVYAHWVKPTMINGKAFDILHCSHCNAVPCGINEHTHYCPECGAEMEN